MTLYSAPQDSAPQDGIAQENESHGASAKPSIAQFPSNGSWSLNNLAAGTYLIQATATDAGHQWTSAALELELGAGAELVGIQLQLNEYGVEGRILGMDGEPWAAASVEIVWGDGDDGPSLARNTDHSFVPITDESGRYFLPLPGAGHYGLHVFGQEVELIAADVGIEVGAFTPIALQDFEVVQAARLSGGVQTFAGDVPNGMQCSLRLGEIEERASVNEKGEYEFKRLRPGLYEFYASAGGDEARDFTHHLRLRINEGDDVQFNALLDSAFRVEGRLEGGDGLYANLMLLAVSTTDALLSRRATMRIDGSFTFDGLYSGEYRLEIDHHDVEGLFGLTEEVLFFVDDKNKPAFHVATLQRKGQ